MFHVFKEENSYYQFQALGSNKSLERPLGGGGTKLCGILKIFILVSVSSKLLARTGDYKGVCFYRESLSQLHQMFNFINNCFLQRYFHFRARHIEMLISVKMK